MALLGLAAALTAQQLGLFPAEWFGRQERHPHKWIGRPVVGGLLVGVAYVGPIVAAVATSAVVSRHVVYPHTWPAKILTWGGLLLLSTAVLVATERLLFRRLLPYAALVRLPMVFPGPAPARMVVAARSGSTRRLQERLEHARAHGVSDEPTEAAAQILSLVAALHAHDRRTRGHAERVRTLTELLADEMRLDEESRDKLRWASLLHDIGKLKVPSRVLNKPGKLKATEWAAIHRHPVDGARITSPLTEWLGPWARAIVEHHEHYDGSGYPFGLKGDAISEGARIVAVADAFEVMTAARAYKRPMTPAAACRELSLHAGTQFDERVVRAFLNISFSRLRWLTGPVSWVAQLPVVGWLPRVLAGTGVVGAQATGLASIAALAGATSVVPSAAAAGTGDGPPQPTLTAPATAATGATSAAGITASRSTANSTGPAPTAGSASAAATLSPPTTTHGNAANAASSTHAASTSSAASGSPAKGSGTVNANGTVLHGAAVTTTIAPTLPLHGKGGGAHLK